VQRLEDQGSSQEALSQVGTGAQADIAGLYTQSAEPDQGGNDLPQMQSPNGIDRGLQ